MNAINFYSVVGVVYDIAGAILLAEALVRTSDQVLAQQSQTFVGGNLGLFGALEDQRHDARFGLALLVGLAVVVAWTAADGAELTPGLAFGSVSGPLRSILGGERTVTVDQRVPVYFVRKEALESTPAGQPVPFVRAEFGPTTGHYYAQWDDSDGVKVLFEHLDLTVVWAFVIAFAIFAYIVMDGFDLGIGILFPTLRPGEERDTAMNSVAPVWDGNETWLVLGGAAIVCRRTMGSRQT